ncbi:26717_t:CDS:2 [Dentiscutata erythropus]|uniref:26717_t:CDS:1 n=1 Tax=Dentiscutata erythropus TaxID=1348616 RepID=A0A9N9AJX4_9GLOM|nr:26717_t:CDS:2 [Dentiscutata erythropus]
MRVSHYLEEVKEHPISYSKIRVEERPRIDRVIRVKNLDFAL